MRLILIATLPLAGCSAFSTGRPIVTPSSAACSSLLPESWREGVPGAPLPEGSTVGDWVAFGDAQTARLDQANGRTRDAIGIVARCESRDAQAVQRATRRRFLGL